MTDAQYKSEARHERDLNNYKVLLNRRFQAVAKSYEAWVEVKENGGDVHTMWRLFKDYSHDVCKYLELLDLADEYFGGGPEDVLAEMTPFVQDQMEALAEYL